MIHRPIFLHVFTLLVLLITSAAKAQNDPNCAHISCFSSVCPALQDDLFYLPSTHTFQLLLKQGESYKEGGIVPGSFDFTGYIPVDGSSVSGTISLNHETVPTGAVSMLHVSYSDASRLWNINASGPVDFTPIERTLRNCSGTVTPWGTSILGEEVRTLVDTNSDGFQDVGWFVEMNPMTHQVADYGTGTPQKLWAMGRMRHENLVISNADWRTVYFGEDFPTGALYKYIADVPGNLSHGRLFTLKLDSVLASGQPQTPYGRWIPLDNSTQVACNFAYDSAAAKGATVFNGIEDVEISPIDGRIYLTSKGHGRIYRFTDQDSIVSDFEVYAGGRNYEIVCDTGTVSEPWDLGNDNLAFDDLGNLWVLQDGGKNFIWMIHQDHSTSNPHVELFGRTPNGSEPTGITFSPDHRFIFMSMQHPSASVNAQIDASGNEVAINASSLLVIARKENLGQSPLRIENTSTANCRAYPNPSQGNVTFELAHPTQQITYLKLFNGQGTCVHEVDFEGALHTIHFEQLQLDRGFYWALIRNGDTVFLKKLVWQ